MKKLLSTLLVAVILLTCAPLQGFVGLDLSWLDFGIKADAATSGYYTYTVTSMKATITKVNTSISGDVTIPSTLGGYPVISIEEDAFYMCTGIETITLPDSLTTISNGELGNCYNLKSIIVSETSQSFSNDENGVLFSKDKTTLIQYPCGKEDSSYIVPDYVTDIKSYAFADCDHLYSVIIPESVTSMGSYVFRWCDSLEFLTFPDHEISIGTGILLDSCYYKNTYNWHNDMLYVGNHLICAKDSISGIQYVKDGTKHISDSAFKGCDYLYSITIPDSVISIGNDAFYYCEGLVEVIIGNGIKSIGTWAFYNCGELKRLTLGNNIETIGLYAFYNCYNLKNITLPDSVIEIGDSVFYGCTRLLSVTLGNSLNAISPFAFYNCRNLQSITIPKSVTSISDSAFNGCSKLANVYYTGTSVQWDNIAISSSGNSHLSSATLHYNSTGTADEQITEEGSCGNDVSYKFYADGTLIISGTGPMTDYKTGTSPFYENTVIENIVIEEGVTSIGSYSFDSCTSVKNITIAKSVTSIGAGAFYHCTSLLSLTIPEGVDTINSYTFYECWSLKSLTIKSSATKIYNTAFFCCNDLTDVYYIGSSEQWHAAYDNSGNALFGIFYSQTTIHYNTGNDNAINPGETKNITVNAGTTTLLKFTPSESDEYIFYSSGTSNTYGYIYDADKKIVTYNDNCKDSTNFSTTCRLIAGTTYYLGAKYTSSSSSGSFDVTLTKKCEISPGESKDITIKAGSVTCLSFTPEATGSYTFCSNGNSDTYGILYGINKNQLSYSDDDGENRNFKITYTLTAGTTYYWGARFYSSSSNGSFNVSLTHNNDIAAGETRNISITSRNLTYLKFTPEETARYTLYSSGSADTYGFLYDADKNQIARDDNSGNNGNFKITCTLEAGTTYYWAARYYKSSTSGSFSVTLICDNDINPGETRNIFITSGLTTYLKFKAAETSEYTFYSSGDSDTYGILCDANKNQLAYNDDGGENRNFKITYNLTAGTTYYWGARFYTPSQSGYFDVTLDMKCTHKNKKNYSAVANTCTTDGLSAGVQCIDCSEWIEPQQTIPAAHTDTDNNYFCDICQAKLIEKSGSCGADVTYILYADGELVISGTGNMYNYSSSGSPFLNTNVKNAVIENGVTNISNYLFYNCASLESIIIPDTVTRIGSFSLFNCSSIKYITLPYSLTDIGKSAFYGCNNLKDVYYSGTKENWTSVYIDSNNSCITNATIHFSDRINNSIPDGYIGIYEKSDLEKIRSNTSGNYILMNNLFFNKADFEPDGAFYNNGKGWLPDSFSGILDGNGFSIVGLYINASLGYNNMYTGFVTINYGTIKNLSFSYTDLTAQSIVNMDVGIVCGKNEGLIENCHTSGEIFIKFNSQSCGDSYIGGIAGISCGGTIRRCSNSANIGGYNKFTFPYMVCGGILGGINSYNGKTDTIEQCYNTGNFTPYTVSDSYFGGIAGRLSMGTLSDNSVMVYIKDCYNSGSFAGTGNDSYKIGGIAGEYHKYTNIINCYNVGSIGNNSRNYGGITASIWSGILELETKISSCYYLDESCDYAQYTSESSFVTGNKLSSNQMKLEEYFKEFDFENVWIVDAGSDYPYPQLINNTQSAEKPERHKYTVEILSESTCVKEGVRRSRCTECSIYVDLPLPLAECTYPYKNTTEATHFADGCIVYSCICGNSYTEILPMLTHETEEFDETIPDCTESGYTEGVYCAECDEWISGHEEIPANGHDEISYEAKAATCTEIGWDTYVTCRNCDYTTYNEIPATEHPDQYIVGTINATCTEIGYTIGLYCPDCESWLMGHDVIPAKGHSIVTHEAKDPTCTDIGWDTYESCSVCDYTTYAEKAALGHNEISHEAKAPTCTDIGWDAYVSCYVCTYTTYAELPANGHSYTDIAAQAPTCTEIGWEAYQTCKNCDYTSYEEIVATGHTYIDHDAKEPTCTEVGWEAYQTCKHCDYSTYKEKAATKHKNKQLVEGFDSTCTETGYTDGMYCNDCKSWIMGHTEISAKGHTETTHESKAPTCTEIGWEAYVTCSECNYTTYEELSATGHSYNAVVTKPTCTADGYTTYSCTCGDTYITDKVSAKGHTETTHEAKAPTCTEIGWEAYVTCSECNYTTYEELPAKGHNHNAVVTPPTCTDKGYTTYTCECGNSYDDNYTEKLDHEYTSEITTQPTHLTEGVKTFTCKCGDSYTEPVAKLAEHTYTSEVTKEATHLAEGETTYTCACGDSYTEAIAKLTAHTYKEVVTPPTCTDKGYTTYTCECGDSYVGNHTNKLPHEYTSEITAEPTHLTEGVKTFTCKCGDSYTEPVAKLTEHTYTSEVTKEATHLEEGKTTYTCACGYTYTEAIAKLTAHTYEEVVTAPTCTANGYTTYTCECGNSYDDNYTEKLDHEYTSEITAEPTHLTEGVKTFTCKCGDSYTEPVAKLTEHTYTSEVTKEATHLEEGETTYTCACGDSYTEAIAKLTAHTYEEVVTAPTCTANGYTTYTCACGESYVGNHTDKLPHEYTSEITAEPTHLTEGVKTFTCKCGNSYTESVAKLTEHTYTSEVTKEATHLAEGETTYTCACGDSYTEAIAKLTAHTYKEVVTPPTCTDKGYTTYTCTCGDTYTADEVAAKSHIDVNSDYKCDYGCGYEFEKPEEPTTQAPVVTEPATQPATQAPVVTEPTTQHTTQAPVVTEPTTQPTTQAPVVTEPTTQPTTQAPVVTEPTTTQPTTQAPASTDPTTTKPAETTTAPVATEPTTQPTTQAPTVTEPTTEEPTTVHTHTEEVIPAVEATYTKTGLTEGKKCSECDEILVKQKKVARKKLKKVTSLKKKAVKLNKGSKSTLTLSWKKVTGAEKYEVYQYVNKKWKKIGTTKKTTLTVKKLKANKSYKFKVRAVAGTNKGSFSKVLTAKTTPLKTTLKVKAGKKQLTASWKKVANITGYEVMYSTSKKFTKKTTKTATIKKAKTTKKAIKNLKKSKKYYVRVRTYKIVNGNKIYSAWSSVKSVKVK